ncbi:MAG: Helix-turn-helix domain protein [Lentisphaerae bacterium ADurb.Bin242]|nr:MAG: Helix-turn-helix domain protein [Lentisphaerae bacterium ADurb.Bin242]
MYLGVKRDSIYRWIEKRGLPAYRIGRLWKFTAEDLDTWVKAGKAANDKPGNKPDSE